MWDVTLSFATTTFFLSLLFGPWGRNGEEESGDISLLRGLSVDLSFLARSRSFRKRGLLTFSSAAMGRVAVAMEGEEEKLKE